MENLIKTLYWFKYWTPKNVKNDFENDFFKLMTNAVFHKAMETLENIKRFDRLLQKTKGKLLYSWTNLPYS